MLGHWRSGFQRPWVSCWCQSCSWRRCWSCPSSHRWSPACSARAGPSQTQGFLESSHSSPCFGTHSSEWSYVRGIHKDIAKPLSSVPVISLIALFMYFEHFRSLSKKSCLHCFLIRNSCHMNLSRTIPREPPKICHNSVTVSRIWFGLGSGGSFDRQSQRLHKLTLSHRPLLLSFPTCMYILSLFWTLHHTKWMKTEDITWAAGGLPPLPWCVLFPTFHKFLHSILCEETNRAEV